MAWLLAHRHDRLDRYGNIEPLIKLSQKGCNVLKNNGLHNRHSPIFPLGPELVTNGDFSSDTAWNKGTGWSISGGVATKTPGTASDLSQNLGLVQNRVYETKFTLTVASGTFIVRMGSSANLVFITTSGEYKFSFNCPGTSGFLFLRGDANFFGTIDNVSVREIL